MSRGTNTDIEMPTCDSIANLASNQNITDRNRESAVERNVRVQHICFRTHNINTTNMLFHLRSSSRRSFPHANMLKVAHAHRTIQHIRTVSSCPSIRSSFFFFACHARKMRNVCDSHREHKARPPTSDRAYYLVWFSVFL